MNIYFMRNAFFSDAIGRTRRVYLWSFAAMKKDEDIEKNRAIEKLATHLVEQVRNACINGKKESAGSLSVLETDKKKG